MFDPNFYISENKTSDTKLVIQKSISKNIVVLTIALLVSAFIFNLYFFDAWKRTSSERFILYFFIYFDISLVSTTIKRWQESFIIVDLKLRKLKHKPSVSLQIDQIVEFELRMIGDGSGQNTGGILAIVTQGGPLVTLIQQNNLEALQKIAVAMAQYTQKPLTQTG